MKFKYNSDWCVVCNSHHLVIQEITTTSLDCVLTNLKDRAMDTTVGMVLELGLEMGRKSLKIYN